MSATGDDAWKDREAAVLALGAIGEGCINGLYPHLSEVVFDTLYGAYCTLFGLSNMKLGHYVFNT